MPTIVNPYRVTVEDPYKPVSSIGDALASLGDTLFGPKAAQADLMRQKSGQLRREEANLPLLADAIAAGADPSIIAKHGILSGLDPKNAYGYNQGVVVGRSPNVMDPAVSRSMMMVPGTSYSSTPQGYERGQQVELQKSENAVRKAAEAQIAIADRTPVSALDANDNPVLITQGELQRSMQDNTVPIGGTAPTRYRPVLTDAQQKGVLKGQGFPSGYDGWTTEQKVAADVLPATDKALNYVVIGPNGQIAAQGRTVDNVTDLTTGAPLPGNAMLVSPLNQGGLKAFEAPTKPGQVTTRDAQSAIRHADQTLAVGEQILTITAANPTVVGPVGNIRRLGQEAADVVSSVKMAMGGDANYAANVQAARQDIQTRLGPRAAAMLPELFDPDLNSVTTLNGFLLYKAASALGQDGKAASDRDLARIREMVGDPSSWSQGPTTYRDKVTQIMNIVRSQRESDLKILQQQDVTAGRPVGAVSSPDVESLVKKYAP